jgi:asparagine synthetase B (glutamine-hydrolysing)
MCGICRIIYSSHGHRAPEDNLHRMRQALIHRGPDDAGMVIEDNAGLAH